MSCPAGQTRNRTTGRCRKPCERHQAINPATGRCVSKNYLRKINRECNGGDDKIYSPYGSGSKNDYRDGLVSDPLCHPRKRNIYTGRCKTPCGKGYRINPRTGRCVTLGYLLSLNPDDYDTDYDDDSAAEILFTPTDLSTGAGVVTPYDNSVTKDSEHFKSNTLTENDLVVMGAAYRASEVGMQFRKTIAGVYSPKERKECIEMTKKQGFKPAIYSECGLKEVQSYDKTSTDPAVRKIDIARMIAANSQLDENKFVFVTDEYRTLNPHLLTELGEVANRHPVRLLIANFYGVWRILIPKVKDAAKSTLPTSIMAINDQAKLVESAGHINFRKFALKVHGVVKAFDNIHVSFAPYPETEG